MTWRLWLVLFVTFVLRLGVAVANIYKNFICWLFIIAFRAIIFSTLTRHVRKLIVWLRIKQQLAISYYLVIKPFEAVYGTEYSDLHHPWFAAALWWLIYWTNVWLWCPRFYFCIRTRHILRLFIRWRFGQRITSKLGILVCKAGCVVLCICSMLCLRFVRLVVYASRSIVRWDVFSDLLALITKLFLAIIWKLIIKFSSWLLLNIKDWILLITWLVDLLERLSSVILPLYLLISLFCGTSSIVLRNLSYLLILWSLKLFLDLIFQYIFIMVLLSLTKTIIVGQIFVKLDAMRLFLIAFHVYINIFSILTLFIFFLFNYKFFPLFFN